VSKLIDEIKRVNIKYDQIIVLTSPVVRLYFKRMTEQFLPDLTVLSFNEIENNIRITVVGNISVN